MPNQPHLTVLTMTGEYTMDRAEGLTQAANWSQFFCADNFLKWLYVRALMVDRKSAKAAKLWALDMLINGSDTVVDVRWK